MKTGFKVLCILLFPAITLQAKVLTIKLGLFSTVNVQSYIFTPVHSCYLVQIDSVTSDSIRPGDILYASLFDDRISLRTMQRELGTGKEAIIRGCDSSAIFNLRPAFPAIAGRLYDDDLILRADLNRILAINLVDFDLYIAGVIESEGGTRATTEYYKAQAVLCRTYALQNFYKHAGEGFNLCDGVHCQAYFSRSDLNDEIYRSVVLTRGEVAMYADTALITAVFHSNCGGETQNSENVWVTAAPYLRSVKDPWCREGRNARWQKTFTLDDWRKYVVSCGMAEAENLEPEKFNFVQRSRKEFYPVAGDSIPVKKIRTDWMLKSGFFSVTYIAPDRIVIDGRGYGHGIGLCQEGAMAMARKGFNYKDILQFYFTGISIRNMGDQVPAPPLSH